MCKCALGIHSALGRPLQVSCRELHWCFEKGGCLPGTFIDAKGFMQAMGSDDEMTEVSVMSGLSSNEDAHYHDQDLRGFEDHIQEAPVQAIKSQHRYALITLGFASTAKTCALKIASGTI